MNTVTIQFSYTEIRIPMFWLADYTSYNATTTLTSFSWSNSRGVDSTHHCHYTMASATKMLSQSNFKTLLKSFCIHLITMFMYFAMYFVKKKKVNF